MAKKLLKLSTLLGVILVIFMLAGCPVTPQEVTLTMKAPEGEGEVNPSVGDHTVLKGDEVTFTATPAEHWDFSKWIIGEEEVTDNPKTMEIKEDTEVQAVFVQETYELEITETGEGTVTADPEEGYTYGTEVELTAEAEEGWEFDKWVVDGEEKTDNPLTITIEGDTEVEAIFVEEAEEYTLTMLEPDGEGSTSPTSPGTYTYEEGTEVELTATADEGWDFDKWEIDGTEETENPATVTMDADKEAKAFFKREEYTLTMEIAQGEGEVAPAEGEHKYLFEDEVTLRATPATGYSFLKWMVDGVEETENPLDIEITGDTEVEAYFVDEMPPEVMLEKESGDLLIIEAPCSEPVDGLVYRYRVSDPKDALESASWKVSDPEGTVVATDVIPESKYGDTWTLNITEELLGDNPLGGEYTLTVQAENEFGLTAEKEVTFYVHVNNAGIGDWEFTEGVETYEGDYILPYNEEGEWEVTLEATISLDSKVQVVIYAVDGDVSIENCNEYVEVYREKLTREASSTEKESFTFTVTKEDFNGMENPKLYMLLHNPLCGTLPCNPCPDDELIIDLSVEEEVTLECLSSNCGSPCDVCWPGFFNPGLQIDGLLFGDKEYFEDFFNVNMVLNGKDATDLTYEGNGEARAKVTEDYFPELEGNYDFDWTVTTVTGQEVTETCNATFDFVEPTQNIDLDCACTDTEVVNFLFEDGVGLKEVYMDFENVESVEFDATPTSKTGNKYTFDPKGVTSYSLSATVTVDTSGETQDKAVEYTIYAWAQDTFCNVSEEASETCEVDTIDPNVHFGLDCEYCLLECGATQTVMKWLVEDATFEKAEIEVSHGTIDGEEVLTVESAEGTALWTFEGIDCEDITATMTAVDECGNETVKTFKSSEKIDNVDPVINEFSADQCFDLLECDSTQTWLTWDVSDECIAKNGVSISVNVGYLDSGTYEPAVTSSYSTTTASGKILWNFKEEFDCTYPQATLTVSDECGNSATRTITSDTKVDHLAPRPEIYVQNVGWDSYRQFTKDATPSCDASCVYINWVIEENCLDDYKLVANYPNVTCGSDVEAVEGTYEIDLGVEHVKENGLIWGSKKICLPLLDCDTYVATLTAVDDCDNNATVTSSAHSIDRKPPDLTMDWSTDTDQTGCATEATLTLYFTDGSYPCEGCGETACCGQGGYEWELESGDASDDKNILVGEGCGFEWDEENEWYYGEISITLEGTDCDTLIATATVWDCCELCDDPYNETTKTLSLEFDALAPRINTFELTEDASGATSEATTIFCNATSTYISWEATDNCFDSVDIDVSHGELVGFTSVASGVVLWEFGDVPGKDITATITVSDECNETIDATTIYVRNTGPEIEWWRFDANTGDTIQIRFDQPVEVDNPATAMLYHYDQTDEEWLPMAYYDHTVDASAFTSYVVDGKGLVTIDVTAYATNFLTGEPEIDADKLYGLKLYDVYATDETCEGQFYMEPNPDWIDGFGKVLAPEF